YMAYLQGQNNKVCGGFLVDLNWVMTAAQCYELKPLNITLGARTIQKKEESQQTFEVQEYHRHPEFNPLTKKNDILLLKLKGNATRNNNVGTIDFERSNSRTEVAHAATLRKATITIVKQRECLNIHPGHGDVICGDSSPAWVLGEGDAGDPLICKNKAHGIFSYSQSNRLSYYTRIASHVQWINKIMK
ncbi:GRZ1 protein, partial [Chloroceryle aenea]|nr:GRZ1 protein [Chloroceryle aenea]